MDDSVVIRFKLTEQELLNSEERFCRLLQENLTDIASSLTSDHDRAFDRILDSMLQTAGYGKGLFLLHTAPFYVKKAARGEPEDVCHEATVAENDPLIKSIAESKGPLFLTDIELKYFGVPVVARTLLGIPILFREQAVAITILYSDVQGERPKIDLKDLAKFTAQAGIALDYIRLFSDAKKLATTDGLTGLYNETHLFKLAEIEFSRSERYNHPFSVLIINVDRFKEINDAYGRAAGNQILQILSRTMGQTMRNTDIAGRHSGDEFMVVLPETGADQTRAFADRLLRALLIEPFAVPGHGAVPVTISIGISCLNEGTACFSGVFEMACKALYSSMKNGGNQATILI